jgi:hypothetical protein
MRAQVSPAARSLISQLTDAGAPLRRLENASIARRGESWTRAISYRHELLSP